MDCYLHHVEKGLRMKFPVIFITRAAICSVLIAGIGVAQKKTNSSKQIPIASSKTNEIKEGDSEEPSRLRLAALGIIESEVEQAKKYNVVSASVMVITRAADVTWKSNGAKAKEWLQLAYELTNQVEPPKREGEPPSIRGVRIEAFRTRLRGEIVATAQKHEPAFAKVLIGEPEENKSQLTKLHYNPQIFGTTSSQKKALAQLAQRIAPTNPQQSVELSVESLGFGVPQEFGAIFQTLIKVDRPAAFQLFKRSVEVFVSDPSPNLYDPLILATYLRLLPEPEPDVMLVRAFLNASLLRAKKSREMAISSGKQDQGMSSAIYTLLNDLKRWFQIYWPDRAREVHSLSHEVLPDTFSSDQARNNLNQQDIDRKDPEGLLKAAELQSNTENRDSLVLEAALLLLIQEDYRRAIEVAESAKNNEKREMIIGYIYQKQAEQVISKGDLHEAYRLIKKIDSPEAYADLTLNLVNAWIRKNDNLMAREVLGGALSHLEKNAEAQAYARAYLWLISTYVKIDPNRGFELMSGAVSVANKSIEFDDLSPEQRIVNLGGLSRQAISVGIQRGDLLTGFRRLAVINLFDTISIANGFQNDLLRGLSKIAAASAFLDDVNKTESNNILKSPVIR